MEGVIGLKTQNTQFKIVREKVNVLTYIIQKLFEKVHFR